MTVLSKCTTINDMNGTASSTTEKSASLMEDLVVNLQTSKLAPQNLCSCSLNSEITVSHSQFKLSQFVGRYQHYCSGNRLPSVRTAKSCLGCPNLIAVGLEHGRLCFQSSLVWRWVVDVGGLALSLGRQSNQWQAPPLLVLASWCCWSHSYCTEWRRKRRKQEGKSIKIETMKNIFSS